jgi:UDP-glucose 4-epimerase
LSNPYGERQNPFAAQGVIAVFLNKILRNEEITIWGDGEVIRDYVYIKDAVKALASSIAKDSKAKTFNLSAGAGHSLNQLIQIMKEVSGKEELKVKFVEKRSLDVPASVLDNTLIEAELGWKPSTTLRNGIERTYNYLKSLNE